MHSATVARGCETTSIVLRSISRWMPGYSFPSIVARSMIASAL